jgi:ADP-heptose:LPS heptosyltransferase
MRGATAVVGPDCGPLHLAVAVGTPSVHLFGPSDPVRYGPWGDPRKHRVIRAGWTCPSCGDLSMMRPVGCGCMLAIQADDVMTAIDELVGARHGR